MDYPTAQAPFFFQMIVNPTLENIHHNKIHGCFSTIIIFAKSGEKARERVGRFLAIEKWEIVEIKRVQRLNYNTINKMNKTIMSIYRQAEQNGIGHLFDTW